MENMSDRYYSLAMPRKPPAPSDVADKFMLRMPEGMRDRIALEAEKNKRSMNAEIIDRLEATFQFEDYHEEPKHVLTDIIRSLEEQQRRTNDLFKLVEPLVREKEQKK
jgi:hypothetical protein